MIDLLCYAAPLGSFVANRFSHRVAIMAGCFITSLAMLCSLCSNSMLLLLLSYGVIGGELFGCLPISYMPSLLTDVSFKHLCVTFDTLPFHEVNSFIILNCNIERDICKWFLFRRCRTWTGVFPFRVCC